MMRLLTLTTASAAALVLALPGARAEEPSETTDFVRGMVRAAQFTFETARAENEAGHADRARELADQSYRILFEAEKFASEQDRAPFPRLYQIFWRERSSLDPVVRDRSRVAQSLADKAFGPAPQEPQPPRDAATPLTPADLARIDEAWAPHVEESLQVLMGPKHGFLQSSLDRSLRYLPDITLIFREAGIPEELAYMALVESGFRPDPSSGVGAKGLWQFMPATARQFGLRVDDTMDEREDPLKSTRAAAQYLNVLHARFRDWPLAVAAYNCGEGRIEKSRGPQRLSYWQLIEQRRIPTETARYVPAIVAATLISRDPASFGFRKPSE